MSTMPGGAARPPRHSLPAGAGPAAGEHIDVEQQLALLVLELAARHGVGHSPATPVILPISQRDLARWAGLPETAMTPVLASWHAQGFIRASHRRLAIIDSGGLERAAGRHVPRAVLVPPPAWAGQNCSILFADITAFGAHDRDDYDRWTVRRRMYEIIRDGFDSAGVSWVACHHEDRGDGALVVIPPSVPTVSLVDPMLARLAAALRRHNHQSSDAVRIQLRVALNVGPVVTDTEGVSGESIIHTARLLESPVLKEQIVATGADLGVIVSTFVYDTVVKHGPGHVDATGFRQVHVRVKESELTGWMHLTGTAGSVGTVARPTAADHRYPSVTINVAGDLILGGKIEFRRAHPALRRVSRWRG